MVFKLVRTDTEDPYKIQLEIGTHLIGRGKFLNCDDKRVSRNHGELEVNEDIVIMKALHQNPCFYIKKGLEDTQILRQDSTVKLNNGDKFGMLPDSYWYEVLHCIVPDVDRQIPEQQVVTDNYTVDTEPIEENMTQLGENVNDVSTEAQTKNEDIESPDSPSLLGTVEPTPNINRTEPIKEEAATEDPTDKKDDNVDHESSDENNLKRSHSPNSDSDVTKKVKVEHDVKQEPDDVQPGPSNDQVDASGSADKKSPPPSPPLPQNPQLRERCMYGANCYRRNPQHKAQFSHPSDADWGAGALGQCPWGRGCRRRHPRHWQLHAHPPGTAPPHAPPHAPPQGMQVVQRNGNIFYINAHAVNFYDDHFQVEDSDGDSVDFDYEF